MVLVPRKRYEQLIEIYAINMANITAEEFQVHLTNKASENQASINYIEENKRAYKEKYANIIKESRAF
jgi:acetolactate synthase small subunit